MSGKPYPAGVAALRKLAAKHHELVREIESLNSEIALKTARIKKAREERNSTHKKLITALEKMDCAGSGNYGWGDRIAWMLGEFATQRGGVEAEQSFLEQEPPT